MIYDEINKDLFTVSDDYYLGHCISQDALMGAGIAVLFKRKFDLSDITHKGRKGELEKGKCYISGRVLNLVTKKLAWNKPTYGSFRASLEDMRRVVLENDIKKVAIPQIGSGLDKLDWNKNREIIKEVFNEDDVEILVCIYN